LLILIKGGAMLGLISEVGLHRFSDFGTGGSLFLRLSRAGSVTPSKCEAVAEQCAHRQKPQINPNLAMAKTPPIIFDILKHMPSISHHRNGRRLEKALPT
jgi:hypothetical protein